MANLRLKDITFPGLDNTYKLPVEASDFSTSATYAVGEYCIHDGVLCRCKTAIATAGVWDATKWDVDVKLANDVGDLKTAINKLYVDNEEILFSDSTKKQYIITNGSTVQWDNPSVSYTTAIKWAVVECSQGDKFIINGKGGNADRLWAFADSSKNIISRADAGATETNLVIYAPANAAYLIINDESDKKSYKCKYITEYCNDLQSEIEELQDVSGVGIDVVQMLNYTATSGYMATTGVTYTDSTLAYTNKISVSAGDVIKAVPKYNGKSLTLRFVCAFDGDTVRSDKGATSVTEYTVPDGIDGVVITGFVANSGEADSIPNFFRFTKGTPPKKINTGAFTVSDDLEDNEYLELPINNISKNKVVTFDAFITSFSAIKYNRKGSDEGFRITDTNVEVINSSGVVTNTYPHGLTIENNISFRLEQFTEVGNDTIKIYVSSNGVNADAITATMNVNSSMNPTITSDGSTLTDCVFSFTPTDVNKKVALFGDSYMSISDDRWVGQLKNYGYIDDVLVNQYAGESAAQAVPSLFNIIDRANFRFVVWGIGMNDGADSTTYSDFWKNGIDAIITCCESRGIVPILCTIPTVPSVNNEYKNAWIRNSGYRYIDFAKAVGSQSDGTWFAGMLSNDNVHPSETGAIALCNRALADFPELMQTS